MTGGIEFTPAVILLVMLIRIGYYCTYVCMILYSVCYVMCQVVSVQYYYLIY